MYEVASDVEGRQYAGKPTTGRHFLPSERKGAYDQAMTQHLAAPDCPVRCCSLSTRIFHSSAGLQSLPHKAGIHHYNVIPAKVHYCPGKIPRHSRIRGNSTGKTPSRLTRHIIPTQDYLKVIPAKVHYCPGKIPRHSREGGNPQFPRTREFNGKNTIQTDQTHYSHTGLSQRHSREGALLSGENTPSFPRRRESTIPAYAGIQREKHHPD